MKLPNWVKIPDRINACNKSLSWFVRFYNFATFDLGNEGSRCHCCLFWRGYFLACSMLVVPMLLCILSLPRTAVGWFGIQTFILWMSMKVSEFGEKLD